MNTSLSNPPADSRDDPGRNWRRSPTPTTQKTPWWRLYRVTLAMAIGGLLHIGHQYWFVRSNPPPRFEELQSQQVEVLSWHHLHPQLHIRLTNDQTRRVEFPTLHAKRDTYWVISRDEQRQLVGKTCQMWSRSLRFSVQDRYQVFSLNCEGGNGLNFGAALVDYRDAYKHYRSSVWSILLPGWIILTALFFWAETIRNRKSLQKIES